VISALPQRVFEEAQNVFEDVLSVFPALDIPRLSA
jgi:hypothetical protein